MIIGVKEIPTGIGEKGIKNPSGFRLLQNYPNPFNPSTSIRYELLEAGNVSLTIYNELGQEVITLVNEIQAAGSKSVVWNGRNRSGEKVKSGTYFYELKTGSLIETRKMTFLK